MIVAQHRADWSLISDDISIMTAIVSAFVPGFHLIPFLWNLRITEQQTRVPRSAVSTTVPSMDARFPFVTDHGFVTLLFRAPVILAILRKPTYFCNNLYRFAIDVGIWTPRQLTPSWSLITLTMTKWFSTIIIIMFMFYLGKPEIVAHLRAFVNARADLDPEWMEKWSHFHLNGSKPSPPSSWRSSCVTTDHFNAYCATGERCCSAFVQRRRKDRFLRLWPLARCLLLKGRVTLDSKSGLYVGGDGLKFQIHLKWTVSAR